MTAQQSDHTGDYTADELDAIWVTYQTQGTAACPKCGATLSFDLATDTNEGSHSPTVSVSCAGCGHQGEFAPSARNDSEQDPI